MILSTSVAHPSFVLLSKVVLQIPPFANILPLSTIFFFNSCNFFLYFYYVLCFYPAFY